MKLCFRCSLTVIVDVSSVILSTSYYVGTVHANRVPTHVNDNQYPLNLVYTWNVQVYLFFLRSLLWFNFIVKTRIKCVRRKYYD